MNEEKIKKELKAAKKEMQMEGFKVSKESEKIAFEFASKKINIDQMVKRAIENAEVRKV